MSKNEQIDKMLRLRAEGKTETEIAEALGLSTAELRLVKNRYQMEVGKAIREQAQKMSEEGKTNQEIAAELGITEALVRQVLAPPDPKNWPPGLGFGVQKVEPND